MENSMNSISKPFACDGSSHSAEESGWTMYFDDFFANNINCHVDEGGRHGEHSCLSSYINCDSSSMLSDAASSVAAGKFAVASGNENLIGENPRLGKTCKRLAFRKRKTKGAFVDDDLEDTASSPANSPKVFDQPKNFNKDAKQNNTMNISHDKASSSGHTEERNKVDYNERDNDDEIKKKGLCQFPLSMIVNYLG
ncbi:hypothetical protein SLE2022_395730 [Rubroshorea leprosula]